VSENGETKKVLNDAESLRRSLAFMGVSGRVEARDRLAVLTLADASVMRDAGLRRRAVALAREHGFANLALEIEERAQSTERATLSRD
jgi:hypothetical protein